jgi:transposase
MSIDLPPKPSRESLVAMCRDEPEKAADLILLLWDKVEKLTAIVEEQGREIAALKAKLAKNSQNSSRPPSTDKSNPGGRPPAKPKTKRGGRTNRPGGQKGHKGTTLEKQANPDHTIELPGPARCKCGCNLSRVEPSRFVDRQVHDLPEDINIEVTEYRAPVCECPGCGKYTTAEFPREVTAPVQYGGRVRAAATYLHTYHLVPYERLGEIFGDLFNCQLSTGALTGFIRKAAARAAPIHRSIKEKVTAADFMHNDETGLSILDKTSWLHTASTPEYVYLVVTAGRSFEDIKSVGVFEGYTGRSIHDFLPAYLKFEGMEHGLCNAHHLRELTYIEEEMGQPWAGEMSVLLLAAKEVVAEGATAGEVPCKGVIEAVRKDYRKILAKGKKTNPQPEKEPGKRGRPAKGKSLNLLERFENYEEEVLAFLIHGVPFDNNEAERDLRMMKTRQKISGCFRSLEWSNRFAKIRSVIASAKKKSVGVYEMLQLTLSDTEKAEKLLFET